VLKVARTIADLAGRSMPSAAQVGEAVQYRRAFGSGWGEKYAVKTWLMHMRAFQINLETS